MIFSKQYSLIGLSRIGITQIPVVVKEASHFQSSWTRQHHLGIKNHKIRKATRTCKILIGSGGLHAFYTAAGNNRNRSHSRIANRPNKKRTQIIALPGLPTRRNFISLNLDGAVV